MHVGILTGGGDCPGLNAVIRAVTLAGGRALAYALSMAARKAWLQ